MLNPHDDYRHASTAHALARRRYGAALSQAHKSKKIDLEAAYVAELAAEIRKSRALKRMMTE